MDNKLTAMLVMVEATEAKLLGQLDLIRDGGDGSPISLEMTDWLQEVLDDISAYRNIVAELLEPIADMRQAALMTVRAARGDAKMQALIVKVKMADEFLKFVSGPD